MITINLLPEEYKKKIRKRKINLPKIAFLPILAGFLGIFIGFYILLLSFVFFETKALGSLKAKWDKIAPDKKDVDIIKDEISKINNKVLVLNKLMNERALWSKRLNDISDSMISGVWLRKLSIGEKIVQIKEKDQDKDKKKGEEKKVIKYITLEGSAIAKGGEETALVGRFIKSLKSNEDFYKDFKDIELGLIQSLKQNESDIVDFEIFCYFK